MKLLPPRALLLLVICTCILAGMSHESNGGLTMLGCFALSFWLSTIRYNAFITVTILIGLYALSIALTILLMNAFEIKTLPSYARFLLAACWVLAPFAAGYVRAGRVEAAKKFETALLAATSFLLLPLPFLLTSRRSYEENTPLSYFFVGFLVVDMLLVALLWLGFYFGGRVRGKT